MLGAVGKCFGESAGNESVLLACNDRCNVLAGYILYSCKFLVTQHEYSLVVGRVFHYILNLTVLFKKLYCKVTRREVHTHRRVFFQGILYHRNALLNLFAKIHMNVTHRLVVTFIYTYHRVKQLVDAASGA